MITLYGIKNCDTVKKARAWLEHHKVDYHFHDFRADGLGEPLVKKWIAEIGLETLVNKRSTTWKELNDSIKDNFNADTAVAVIVENPTLIKRPLLDTGTQGYVGFKDAEYSKIFN
ncbi:ArsC family reductase [Cellvibrio mixtus]|uniref:ArsC family reductase n=1 Tax=Cellvibrio mixtus TaxID=39650 RepID=A0A266Q3G7_9GAMM|nr:ArsC family reductase [Cellvibrio mixtus]OZY84424.1 ArsC family reductase [Cellvibrio mixtus]